MWWHLAERRAKDTMMRGLSGLRKDWLQQSHQACDLQVHVSYEIEGGSSCEKATSGGCRLLLVMSRRSDGDWESRVVMHMGKISAVGGAHRSLLFDAAAGTVLLSRRSPWLGDAMRSILGVHSCAT